MSVPLIEWPGGHRPSDVVDAGVSQLVVFGASRQQRHAQA
jgi:hypothetical protein